jgi:GAF domain-containing protein
VADGRSYAALRQASEELEVHAGEDLAGLALASRRPAGVPALADHDGFLRQDAARSECLGSGLAFPVLLGQEVAGVVEAFHRDQFPTSGSVLDALATVGSQLARVVERERADSSRRHAEQELTRYKAQLEDAQALILRGGSHQQPHLGRRPRAG